MSSLRKNKISDLVFQLVTQMIEEVKKPHNLDKIQLELLDPIVQYTFSRLYPYILATSVIFFTIFILVIYLFLSTFIRLSKSSIV